MINEHFITLHWKPREKLRYVPLDICYRKIDDDSIRKVDTLWWDEHIMKKFSLLVLDFHTLIVVDKVIST
jgi:hypothetical protein